MIFIVGGRRPSRRLSGLILALTPSALRAVRLGPRRIGNRAMIDAAGSETLVYPLLPSSPRCVSVCVVGRFWGLEPRGMEWSKKFEAREYAESAW